MSDLLILMQSVRSGWPFTPANYPAMPQSDDAATRAFTLKHVSLHVAKSAGALATLSEMADHGVAIDEAKLRELTVKAFVNALKLAEIAELSTSDLHNSITAMFTQEQAA